MSELPDPRTPVTLLTGWLGAGKTTLLNRILAAEDGVRWAVLVNEFGDVGIDDRLVVRSDEDLVELSNGCVCCTVRGDLVQALHRLQTRRPPLFRRRKFDRVLIETTGIAEPGPLLSTFLVEAGVAARYRMDTVACLVDAAHRERALAEPAAAEQVAVADVILLNKADLVDAPSLESSRGILAAMNPLAELHTCTKAEVDLDALLAGARRARALPELARGSAAGEADSSAGDAHAPEHEHAQPHEHEHVHDLVALSLRAEGPLDELKARLWLDACVRMLGDDLLRYKGFLHLAGYPYRCVLQGTYGLYTVEPGEPWGETPPVNELVFIGRDLDRGFLERGLTAAAAS